MLAQPRGGIITNISTVGSIRYPGIAYAGYAAPQAALDQLVQTIAVEHAAHNIRANAIVPWVLDTPMVRTNSPSASAGTSPKPAPNAPR